MKSEFTDVEIKNKIHKWRTYYEQNNQIYGYDGFVSCPCSYNGSWLR
jgi:hypothetical protein